MNINEFSKQINISLLTIPILQYTFSENELRKGAKLYYSFYSDSKKVLFSKKGKKITIQYPYVFSASTNDEKKNTDIKEIVFFSLHVEFKVVLNLERDFTINVQLRSKIIELILPRMLHPYFRNVVSESLLNAGLPPVHLPLYENLSAHETTSKKE